MAIKIRKTSDVKINGVKCVVYGGAGVGKTRLCATAPRPIIISAESGLLSLSDVDVDYIEISKLKHLDEAYRALKDSTDYDTICLDSISEICEALMEEFIPQVKDGRQAYGMMASAMMPMLKKFRDIKGKHTAFTSKLDVVKDEEGNKVGEDLLIPGQVLGKQIPYLVDELFCLQKDRKGNSFLQTVPDRVRFCKDRSGALESQEEPDLSVIFEKIMAKSS